MALSIQPTSATCGARVTGVNLGEALSEDLVAELRAAWVKHHVLIFPDQHLNDKDLVRFTEHFGDIGDDPFFEPIAPDNPVFALTRRADEKAPVFAETWHSDWSFKTHPPIGTCLYSLVIPPMGGDTGFADQQRAVTEMPDALRRRLEGQRALHCAAVAYAPDGFYGDSEAEADRSMKIITNDSARDVFVHDIITKHPESGNETIFGTYGYICGIEGMPDEEALPLIRELHTWQIRDQFQYQHQWQANMLVMWDNRSVLHRAYGGYDGYDRELHRTTIAGSAEYSIN